MSRWPRTVRMALAVLGLIALATLIGPWFSPHAVDAIDFSGAWSAPPRLAAAHWFGTDSLGRDVFVRTLAGGRVSLLVGLSATLVSVLVGVAWGAVAGYFGGRVDAWMMRAVDVLYALPFMFIVILLMVAFGRHIVLVFVAIGLVNWLDMARIVRGQTLALRTRSFVLAAQLCGAPHRAVILRHIVPNLLPTVIACAALTVPQVILIESFLSFLGLGVQEPMTSWGALINDGARDMEQTPWALAFPAGFLAVTLLCLHLLGDGLRARGAVP
ncbi:ABC transporter permease subunit [Fontimonas sp. SYSU GA230001]|uniref:ABC transporter permease n=1 Tax=Fontimonas sp. SYSU GA230001 TaxID=3142450 RepID=UPI0032B3542B